MRAITHCFGDHPALQEIVFLFLLAPLAWAGGPRYVAGVNYFNPETAGTPLAWAQGVVNYYTDQGDLSAQMPGPSADAFVAAAFSRWTSIPTAAVSATRAGQLGEDVSGTNVTANADGSVSLPPDIQPGAVSQPVAVVYDADGSVTDALAGQGSERSLILRGLLRPGRSRQPEYRRSPGACLGGPERQLRADFGSASRTCNITWSAPWGGFWDLTGPR